MMRWVPRFIGVFGAVALAAVVFAGPASATQDVPFAVHLGTNSATRWHAEGSGNITFFSANRKFSVIGPVDFHHSPTNDSFGYGQVRQNVAHTSSDPAWKTIPESGPCGGDATPPGETFHCQWHKTFLSTTAAGHGLAGVWIRICREQPGTDPCGPVQYLDNPFQ